MVLTPELWPQGPIPARAGKPAAVAACRLTAKAYPRSRGETLLVISCFQPALGLSPLARGNLRPTRIVGFKGGPIPARAGKPVYPPTP